MSTAIAFSIRDIGLICVSCAYEGAKKSASLSLSAHVHKTQRINEDLCCSKCKEPFGSEKSLRAAECWEDHLRSQT